MSDVDFSMDEVGPVSIDVIMTNGDPDSVEPAEAAADNAFPPETSAGTSSLVASQHEAGAESSSMPLSQDVKYFGVLLSQLQAVWKKRDQGDALELIHLQKLCSGGEPLAKKLRLVSPDEDHEGMLDLLHCAPFEAILSLQAQIDVLTRGAVQKPVTDSTRFNTLEAQMKEIRESLAKLTSFDALDAQHEEVVTDKS